MVKTSSSICVIHTVSYPYSLANERSFIEFEVEALANEFAKVILVPSIIGGNKYDVPIGVEVFEGYANELARINELNQLILSLQGVCQSRFYYELFSGIFSFRSILKLALLCGKMRRMHTYFKNCFFWDEKVIYYTFWFRLETYFLCYYKTSGTKLVTRVHGVDLYHSRNVLNRMFRKDAMRRIDKVFCISEAGQMYLNKKYPDYCSSTSIRYLGSKKHFGNRSLINSNHSLNFVSCSSLIELKRVDVIFKFLEKLSVNLKGQTKISWTHIGDGPLMAYLVDLRRNVKSPLKVNLVGNLNHEEVLSFYHNLEVDFFIHLSSTEGLPVVMMEAASFSIPIIATNVGGVPEIVKHGINGFLLSPNLDYEEFEGAIIKYRNMSFEQKLELGYNSNKIWTECFNAEENARGFANELKRLL